MQQTPSKKLRVFSMRPTTTKRPRWRRNWPRSPIFFMACESSTSPVIDAKTTARTEHHVYRSLETDAFNDHPEAKPVVLPLHAWTVQSAWDRGSTPNHRRRSPPLP